MADNQITPFQLTDQFTMDNFNQRINETNIALQKKADKDRVVNPNLLDNWYFGNPVDQRQGLLVPPGTTYNKAIPPDFPVAGTATKYIQVRVVDTHGSAIFSDPNGGNFDCFVPATTCVRGYTGSGYGIDRWKIAGQGTLTVDGDGISYTPTTNSNFRQMIEGTSLAGKTVTFSALLFSVTGTVSLIVRNNGTGVKNVSTTNSGVVSATVTLPDDLTNLSVEINTPVGSGFRAAAAKLELGSVQTLAHQENGNWVLNEIPDYGEQLRRCQRYFQKYDSYIWFTLCKDNVWRTNFTFPVAMREAPTVEFETISDISADVVFDNRTKNGISGYASSSANYIAATNLTLNANL